jgi:hypothetical protein
MSIFKLTTMCLLASAALMPASLAANEVNKSFVAAAPGKKVDASGPEAAAARNAELGRLVEFMLVAPDRDAHYSATVTSPFNESTLTVVVAQSVKTLTLVSKAAGVAPVAWKIEAKTSPEEMRSISNAVFSGLSLVPYVAQSMDGRTAARTK